MGIMFEIIGSFVLNLEAFGSKWIEKPMKLFIKFSDWTGKRLYATIALQIILFTPIIAGIFFGNKTCTALFIPILFFNLLFIIIFDEPKRFEKWSTLKFNDKKIGPIGFILILIGNGLQLISTVISIE